MSNSYESAILKTKSAVAEREQQELEARTQRQAIQTELLARMKRSYEEFILPRMEELNTALFEAGYKNLNFNRGIVSPDGFLVEISGTHPLDGKPRDFALTCFNAISESRLKSWQNMRISFGGQQRPGNFSPDLNQETFERMVKPYFFPEYQ